MCSSAYCSGENKNTYFFSQGAVKRKLELVIISSPLCQRQEPAVKDLEVSSESFGQGVQPIVLCRCAFTYQLRSENETFPGVEVCPSSYSIGFIFNDCVQRILRKRLKKI